MKISDLTPQERQLLFLFRLSDALPAPVQGLEAAAASLTDEQKDDMIQTLRDNGIVR